ncbi:MAG: hypothetical protein U1E11_03145, partial [Dethiobacteria bacterium]|nr:hypothetical protein [Dethiobacteria bacterium]
EGIYESGDTAIIIAEPDRGYNFYGWHENGSIVSFDSRFEFTVERDQLLTAVFEPQGKAEIFDIILHIDPQGCGTVQGEGIYTPAETAVIVAIPETQYQFDGWTENGDVVSTAAEYQFIVTGNRELTATFSLISQNETGDGQLSRAIPAKPVEIEEPTPTEETEETYGIILIVEPKEGGLVSGDGNYLAGDIVGLDAIPAEGYAFSGWLENGEEVSMAKAYAFTVDRERTLTATFSPLLSRQHEFAETYRISLAPQPLDGGRVYGGGEYTEGETITINALPNMDFYFQNWTENGIEVSSEIIYTFKVERDVKLVANFISLFGNYFQNSGSYSAADDFERFLGSYFADFLVPTLSPTESDSPTLSLFGWTNSLLAPMGDGYSN